MYREAAPTAGNMATLQLALVAEAAVSVQADWRPSWSDCGTLERRTVPDGALVADDTVTVHVVGTPTVASADGQTNERDVGGALTPTGTTMPASKFVPLSCDIEIGALVQIVSGALNVEAMRLKPPPPGAQKSEVIEVIEGLVKQAEAVAVLGRLDASTSKYTPSATFNTGSPADGPLRSEIISWPEVLGASCIVTFTPVVAVWSTVTVPEAGVASDVETYSLTLVTE